MLCPQLKIPHNATLVKEPLKDVPLGMMPNSVDDMLLGCGKDTMNEVQRKFLDSEKKEFPEAWRQNTFCILKNLLAGWNKGLTREQLEAICVYTAPLVYKDFNAAVRSQRDKYGSSFNFHYLFVFLTSAVQTLKLRQPCYTTYRRNDLTFTGTVGQKMRFGNFASTSLRKNLRHFGKKTCFEIRTCFGADVSKFSVYPNEKEVLVPPYEQFEIMSQKLKEDKDKPAGLEDCEVVFVLRSVGWKSDLNCKLVGQ